MQGTFGDLPQTSATPRLTGPRCGAGKCRQVRVADADCAGQSPIRTLAICKSRPALQPRPTSIPDSCIVRLPRPRSSPAALTALQTSLSASYCCPQFRFSRLCVALLPITHNTDPMSLLRATPLIGDCEQTVHFCLPNSRGFLTRLGVVLLRLQATHGSAVPIAVIHQGITSASAQQRLHDQFPFSVHLPRPPWALPCNNHTDHGPCAVF